MDSLENNTNSAVTYYAAVDFVPSFTKESYDAITAAIATGATQVQYGDKMVTYRSLNDLIRLRGMMKAEIYGGTSTSFGRRTVGDFRSTK